MQPNIFLDMTNSNTNNTVVGSKIKGIRESKNLTIEEIAERSGLTTDQIVSIENDQNLPSLGPLIKTLTSTLRTLLSSSSQHTRVRSSST